MVPEWPCKLIPINNQSMYYRVHYKTTMSACRHRARRQDLLLAPDDSDEKQ